MSELEMVKQELGLLAAQNGGGRGRAHHPTCPCSILQVIEELEAEVDRWREERNALRTELDALKEKPRVKVCSELEELLGTSDVAEAVTRLKTLINVVLVSARNNNHFYEAVVEDALDALLATGWLPEQEEETK